MTADSDVAAKLPHSTTFRHSKLQGVDIIDFALTVLAVQRCCQARIQAVGVFRGSDPAAAKGPGARFQPVSRQKVRHDPFQKSFLDRRLAAAGNPVTPRPGPARPGPYTARKPVPKESVNHLPRPTVFARVEYGL